MGTLTIRSILVVTYFQSGSSVQTFGRHLYAGNRVEFAMTLCLRGDMAMQTTSRGWMCVAHKEAHHYF